MDWKGNCDLATTFLRASIIIPKLLKFQEARKAVILHTEYETEGKEKRGKHKNTLNYKCRV